MLKFIWIVSASLLAIGSTTAIAMQAPKTTCHPDEYVGHRILAPGETRSSDDDIDPSQLPLRARIFLPGQGVPQSIVPGRLNLNIDDKHVVTGGWCG
jgi:hypothetical protein